MIINHNISALNTHRQLGANNNAVQNSLEKLSSGMKINRAGDDAAGLAISEKMRAQIRGLDMATKNAQDGISMIQTAEGSLNEAHAILQRMRELAVQSASDTNVNDDRDALNKELEQLTNELERIKDNTTFNTQKLLDGSAGQELKFHVGADKDQVIEVDFETAGVDLSDVVDTLKGTEATEGEEAVAGIDISTQDGANKAIETLDAQIKSVSEGRSYLGAIQNRLEHTINNLSNASENLTAAESRIRDTDMAKEMMEFTKNNILTQAAQAMLAQANQTPQGVLQLLR